MTADHTRRGNIVNHRAGAGILSPMAETILLFDDGAPGLSPLTDLRACFELRTGALTTAERLHRQTGLPIAGLIVPDELAGILASRSDLPVNQLPEGDSFLLINGRCPEVCFEVPEAEINVGLVDVHGAIVAARLDRALAGQLLATRDCPDELDCQSYKPPDASYLDEPTTPLIERPWHLMARFDDLLTTDLALLADHGQPLDPPPHVATLGEFPIRAGREVRIHPMVLLDATDGPIVLDDHAEVHAHSVIKGPCYVGPHTRLNFHTALTHAAVGPQCRLGGEINHSIIQGYTNKSHFGFLGHSLLGEWVNLGAGTTTSNLKNTYGPVRVQPTPDAPEVNTELQFLGAILGDHVKTAVGTLLNTGTIAHTGAMIAASARPPKCIPPFAFLTDAGQQCYGLEKFAAVAHRAMQRRGQRVNADLTHRLANLHAQAALQTMVHP